MARKCCVPGCRSGYVKRQTSEESQAPSGPSSSSTGSRPSNSRVLKRIKVKAEMDGSVSPTLSLSSSSSSSSPSSPCSSSSSSSRSASPSVQDPLESSTGEASESQTMQPSMFGFPLKDPELLQHWVDAIPFTKPYQPSQFSSICSLHFSSEDLTHCSLDSNGYRRKRKANAHRIRRFPNSIPSLFPDTPGYRPPFVERPKRGPRKAKVEPPAPAATLFPGLTMAENTIHDLDSIRNGVDKISHLPEGMSFVDRHDHLLFVRFTGRPPWRVAFYLQINTDLTFSAVVKNVHIKSNQYAHLAGKTIQYFSILSELLVFLNHEYKGLPVPKELKKEAIPIWPQTSKSEME